MNPQSEIHIPQFTRIFYGTRGFTLLELLMVVVIVGILASLALPGYYRAAERARAAEATTTLGQIRTASQRFCIQSPTGTPPSALTALDIELPAAGVAQWNYGSFTVVCTPFDVSVGATRNGGPCVNSTVVLDDPPTNPDGTLFTYTWTGPCL